MTGALIQKPNLARALLRAVASGVPEIAQKVAQFHATTTHFFTAFLFDHDAPDAEKERIAGFLQDIWFAKLVGWAGGRGVMSGQRLSLSRPPLALSVLQLADSDGDRDRRRRRLLISSAPPSVPAHPSSDMDMAPEMKLSFRSNCETDR